MPNRSGRTAVLAARSLMFLLLVVILGAGAVDLYAFQSHQQLSRGDEETSMVSLTTPFVFFQQDYNHITVHSNGYISLQETQGPASGSGSGISGLGISGTGVSGSKSSITTLFSTTDPLIGVFVTDVDTSGVGDVFYHVMDDVNDRLVFQQSVLRYFGESFTPAQLLVVTWNNVGYYNTQTDKNNTFQAVLGSDGNESYLFFLYDSLVWTNTDTDSMTAAEELPQVGFSGDGQTYSVLPGANASNSFDFSYYYLDSDNAGYDPSSENSSNSDRALSLQRLSNVAEPGLWAFRVDGTFVVSGDVDECSLENITVCDQNAVCSNEVGGFDCSCDTGFSGSGLTCDINECTNGAHTCDMNADCNNNVGSFSCSCRSGYSGNGAICEDIDECSGGLDNCSEYATCSNTVGSYNCTCNNGYLGDGFDCNCSDGDVRVMEGATSLEGRVEICQSNAYGTVCDDFFDELEAKVVCGQLGYTGDNVVALKGGFFTSASSGTDILQRDLLCSGSEENLLECTEYGSGTRDCPADHTEDAGVKCNALCDDGDVRLSIDNREPQSYELIDDELAMGRVEVCDGTSYGTVCSDINVWENKDASVICYQLGFSPYGAIPLSASVLDLSSESPSFTSLSCTGNESSVSNCVKSMSGVCIASSNAAIRCLAAYTEDGNCLHGDLRISSPTDGNSELSSEGRLEVCINSAWGTICDAAYGTRDAQVACKQLGYDDEGSRAFRNAQFGEGTGAVFLEGLECDGDETSLLDCPMDVGLGLSLCGHSDDAGIRCFDTDQCSVGNGGCDHICTDSIPGHSCSCNGGYVLDSDGQTCNDIDECYDGDYGSNGGCDHSCVNTAGSYHCICNNGYDLVNTTTCIACTDGSVRLVNGSKSTEGRVEVCYNVEYHTVCDDSWDDLEAKVVCSQLGYSSGDSIPVRNSGFGEGNSLSILLDNLMCSGSESSLLDCVASADIGIHDCDHSEDAGVRCEASCEEGSVRLVVGDHAEEFYLGDYSEDYDDSYYDKNGLLRGRVEVCVGGTYGTVCDDEWDYEDASVVCSQLGLSSYGAINVSAPTHFSEGVSPGLLTGVNCSGSETEILDCGHVTSSRGLLCDTAGVVCQDVNTAASNCTTGEVNLVGSDDGDEGRLEVCVNGAWGTVCSDGFDSSDAAVACEALGGFDGSASQILTSGYVVGSGPIFLDQLSCVGSEQTLLNCPTGRAIGLHRCTHSMDVGLSCSDIDECSGGQNNCSEKSVCTNTIGSYQCSCLSGYYDEGLGYVCTDIDECMSDPCDSNATCNNTDGSYTCTCKPGYSGDGKSCANINECETGSNLCNGSADCADTDGSYECMCMTGYSGDGFICENIDECSTGNSICDDNAECSDTPGSYQCTCVTGYSGSGETCSDINECLSIPCDVDATCSNTNGSFSCQCHSGFIGNGISCTHETCFVSSDRVYKCGSDLTEGACEAMGCCYNMSADVQCYYPSDVDECSMNLDDCHTNANCIDMEDGFICNCGTGYTGNGTDCTNLDECLLGTHSCDNNADCTDSDGSYTCMCHVGFTGDGETCSCTDGSVLLSIGTITSSTLKEGTVLVCYNNTYGTVCDDRWDGLEARVVCRQLGYIEGDSIPVRNATFGSRSGSILLDNLMCNGSEDSLLDCVGSEDIGSHNCDHSEDAGVRCEAVCEQGTVRLTLDGDIEDTVYFSEDSIDEFYFIKDELARGRVEVCVGQSYGTVCGDDWNYDDASVVCSQLGFSRYGAFAVSSGAFGDDATSTVIRSVRCCGNESELLDCSLSTSDPGTCTEHSAAVICQDAATEFSSCSDGDVRLIGGNQGRLEVCMNNAWGSVCDSEGVFTSDEAKVACRQLGILQDDVEVVDVSQFGGEPSGPIYLDQLHCDGDEENLSECTSTVIHMCSHQQDVGIICHPASECDVDNGGCDHYCTETIQSYTCSCYPGYTLEGDGHSCTDMDNCSATGSVRLVNGSSANEGRVEVCYNNVYGTVCDDLWDELDARVVCRQLGYNFTDVVAVKNAGFGEAESRPILLDNVVCNGSEEGISQCSFASVINCDHSEDAGVICGALCPDGSVRLVIGDIFEHYELGLVDASYYIKDKLARGRVEVCVGGRYGTVCDDEWDYEDASVVCAQLGFSPHGAIAINGGQFSDGTVSVLIGNVECSGDENGLLECPYVTGSDEAVSQCDPRENAAVTCQDRSTEFVDCETGAVYLTNFTDDSEDGSRQGTLQICINNAWGTVCSDNFYDTTDAEVFCEELQGFIRTGATRLSATQSDSISSPLFLSSLHCTDDDRSLLDDCTHNRLGLAACDKDAGLATAKCFDIDECSEDTDNCSQRCNNTIGSYQCYCDDGYMLDSDQHNCSDVDECTEGTSKCHDNATCINNVGSYDCTCIFGYTGDGFNCNDFSLCDFGPTNCDVNATCIDRVGGFDCECNIGYTGNGTHCTDIDECDAGDDACHVNATCSNTDGSYECDCNQGFTGDGRNCINVVECDDHNDNNCSSDANCTDTIGSYDCTCHSGFSGDGFVCVDIDECSGEEYPCDSNANCTNSIGSFTCTCRTGYTGKGLTCEDINECTMNNDCDKDNGVCNNTNGSYICSCKSGYTGDGFNCSDIDECAEGTDQCDSHADCTNTIGNHNCTCTVGFSGNGSTCECANGDILLYDGTTLSTNHSNGTVLVCYDNEYGTVCDDFWDALDASVVCRRIGFSPIGSIPVLHSDLGSPPNHNIFLDNVVCSGGENSLLECDHNSIGTTNCNRSEEAGVRCEATCTEGDIRLGVGNLTEFYISINEEESYYFIKDELARGRVEVCIGGTYGTVCDDFWDNQDASVACSQLGLSRYGAIVLPTGSFSGELSIVLSDVECEGNESSLLDCPGNTSPVECDSGEGSAIICQGLDTTIKATCEDGDVRLEDGLSPLEGRVEVCINSAWGTVCNNSFSSSDANVVCTQLGHRFNGTEVLPVSEFSQGTGPIFLDKLACHGEEKRVFECGGTARGLHACTHSQDVAIRCIDYNECAINNGGCEQRCVNSILGHYCECDAGYSLDSDNSSCIRYADCSDGVCHCLDGFTDDSSSASSINCVDIDECSTGAYECSSNGYCINRLGGYKCVCSNGYIGNGTNCICNDGDLRLVNGSNSTEGRVEICYNNVYGTVCDDQWGLLDAVVACRKLGFSAMSPEAFGQAYFGQGQGEIYLENVQCNGSENSLEDCPASELGVHDCNHSEDAGVRCQDACTDGRVILLVGDDYDTPFFEENTMAVRGRVEVCVGGRYGTVCDDEWDYEDASVVCRELGFSPYGALNLTREEFHTTVAPTAITGVACVGTESELSECSYSSLTACGVLNDAGVICQVPSLLRGDCETGDVRLADSTDNHLQNTTQGTLQICINNAWGAVCHDDLFGVNDARVACQQAGGYEREIVGDIESVTITGPVFLSELGCEGDEASLLDFECRRYRNIGSDCVSSQDAVITCRDIDECSGNTDNCSHRCNNAIGSYQCFCDDGYTLDSDQHNCSDIDECLDGSDQCAANATCNNTDGGYNCSCNIGYEGDGFECLNTNECERVPSVCHTDANCTDTDGSYECSCKVGYSGNGITCTDINECTDRVMSPCDVKANCTNTVGSFICECNTGYSGDGVNCSNIVECDSSNSPCGANAECKDTDGSFECSCKLGFSGDGFICTDINECELIPDLCAKNATCTNDVGSYQCSCNTGFTGDGTTCTCVSGSVLLYNGSHVSPDFTEGTVLVCHNNAYGTVCDDYWDELEARVVCRQLEYTEGYIPVRKSRYGSFYGSILLDDLLCNGAEDNLLQCDTNGGSIGTHDCDHKEDAGVICMQASQCEENTLRLVPNHMSADNLYLNEGDLDDFYFIKDELHRGRVEACVSGEWGSLCYDEQWDNVEAAVACSQLRFSSFGALGVNLQMPGPIQRSVSDVQCSGQENELLSCVHGDVTNELPCESAAGIVCQDLDTVEANCTDGQVQLVNGSNELEGRVEICFNRAWGTICDSGFGEAEADVVCRQIDSQFAYAHGHSSPLRGAAFGEGSGPIFIDNLGCSGQEAELSECPTLSMIGFHQCDHSLDAGVICNDIDECEIRNSCDDVTRADCVNTVGSFRCFCLAGFSGNGTVCTDNNECLDGNGGCAELCNNTEGSYFCDCFNSGYEVIEKNQSCEDTNECERGTHECDVNATCTNTLGSYDCSCNVKFTGDGFNCSALICEIDTCSQNEVCVDTDVGYLCPCDAGYERDEDDVCICNDWDLRLVNGPTLQEGRVEVCFNNTYGSICHDLWNENDAQVVCRELGFSDEGASALSNAYYNSSSGPIYLDNVQCEGDEASLQSCAQNQEVDDCTHSEDAGVRCLATCQENVVQLQVDLADDVIESDFPHYLTGGQLRVGRVEVCIGGRYGTVCDDSWDYNGASVVCSQLGFSRYGAIVLQPINQFDRVNRPNAIGYLECSGSEAQLSECDINTVNTCGRYEVAGVVCQSISTLHNDCTNGSVRLVGRDINDEGVREGRVEVCVNRAWGTVCDERFTQGDAQGDAEVVCGQLGGFSREGAEILQPSPGSGPVFLQGLSCYGNESNILDCNKLTELGLTNCSHSRDVAVRCRDIDECEDTGVCSQMCTNTIGSYECSCMTGYRLNVTDLRSCDDIDECVEDKDNCDPETANCMNTVGSYECSCRTGYTGLGTVGTCDDINECEMNKDMCDDRSMANCTNTIGSYECSCRPGYTGNGFNCTDIDECSENTDNCSQRCNNTIGSYQCYCDDGYTLDSDQHNCSDIDECVEQTDNCHDERGTCNNTEGSFECSCKVGYTGDGTEESCEDIDECELGLADCDGNAYCTNTTGSYTCTCNKGYTGEGHNGFCEDIDECVEQTDNCDDERGTCNNIEGSFECSCKVGYTGDGTEESCDDIDECGEEIDECDNNSECENTVGSYTCTCHPGYSGTGRECSCIDGEVLLYNGSVMSTDLREGTVLVCYNNTYGTVCDDRWDSIDASVVCGQLRYDNSTSTSIPVRKSFHGPLPDRIRNILLDDLVCKGNESSLLECPRMPDAAIGASDCTHSEDAGVRCEASCMEWEVRLLIDGYYMANLNPDYSNLYIKEELAVGRVEVCLGGSYGSICLDEQFRTSQAVSVVCSQLGFSPYGAIALGGDLFSGGEGPKLNQLNCTGNENAISDCTSNKVDVQACSSAVAICQDNLTTLFGDCSYGDVRLVNGSNDLEGRVEICINNAWGTVCTELISDDDVEVICRQVGQLPPVNSGNPERFERFLKGEFGEVSAPVFLDKVACDRMEQTLLECPRSTQLGLIEDSCACAGCAEDLGVRCPDKDECLLDTHNCSVNANCTNLPGSFQCDCNTGYAGDGYTCRDIDECKEDNGDCNETCINTVGSFYCLCNNTMGYEVGPDGLSCVDINECGSDDLNDCHENATCTNTPGNYNCACDPGYTGDGRVCDDIDECVLGEHQCDNDTSTCVNTNGNYTCNCNIGFTGGDRECEDIDECKSDEHDCHENAYCTNTFGNYNCTCDPGYTGDGRVCDDIDECDSGTDDCSENAECTNTVGRYNCSCFIGYTGNGFTCNCYDGNIRLMGGNNSLEGRVEICQNDKYYTVCDDLWDEFEARVVCNQLNYTGTDVVALKSSHFTVDNSTVTEIFQRDLLCSGNEDNLLDCQHHRGSRDCPSDHSEDAGVKCNAKCTHGDVRLRIKTQVPRPYELVGDELARGRVEVCVDEKFGTICDEFWDHTDASVVCKQLGFSPYGAIGGGEIYGDNVRNSVVTHITCVGNEANILDCPFNSSGIGVDCSELQDAHVVCQAMNTNRTEEPCNDRDLRVVNGTSPREGRVEVCYNQAWGTICNVVYGMHAAEILCTALDFEGGQRRDDFSPSTGPIFVSKLNCPFDQSLSDNAYVECLNEVDLGLSECSHEDEVGVHCEAYCPVETTMLLQGNYDWSRIEAETMQNLSCTYMGEGSGECDIVAANASRMCNDIGKWEEPDVGKCLSSVTETLCNIRNMGVTGDNAESAVVGIEMAVLQANDTEDWSSTNLATINSTFQAVAENDEISVSRNLLESATMILSVIQSWGMDNATLDILQNTSAEIIASFEEMTVKLAEEEDLLDPLIINTKNLAFRGQTLRAAVVEEEGVRFSVTSNEIGILMTEFSAAKSSIIEEQVSISLPPSLFQQYSNDTFTLLFTMLNSSLLLPQNNVTDPSISVASSVISAILLNHEVKDLDDNITIVLRLEYPDSQIPACVVWDPMASENGDWVKDPDGCTTERLDRNFVRCNCNHLSLFGVLVNTDPVVCQRGFRPNEDRTDCEPIEPPISLKETKYTKENTYTVSSSSDSDGIELTYTYIVHDGAQFGVECSSVATTEEEFVGEVTWYKKMISSSGEEELVEIRHVINLQEQGSGSGSNLVLGNQVPSSGADITDFETIQESVGQLYAYYYSNTSVVLGTRSAVNATDPDKYIQMAVGLFEVADGEYMCEVKNFANGTRNITVNIRATTPSQLSKPHYLRFSTLPVTEIQTQLYLDSEEFVIAMFESMIISTLETATGTQRVVMCSSRGDSGVVGEERIECTAKFYPINNVVTREDLLIAYDGIEEQLQTIIITGSSDISDDGFCDYQEQDTPHGMYQWNEAHVGDTDKQQCEFGKKPEASEGSMATRHCESGGQWMEYNGEACTNPPTSTLKTRRVLALVLKQNSCIFDGQEEVTVDSAAGLVNDLVTTLDGTDDEDQTTENLGIVVSLLENVVGLLNTENFKVDEGITENAVEILDDISDWPADVVEEQSAMLVMSFESIGLNLVNQSDFELLEVVSEDITMRAQRPSTETTKKVGLMFAPSNVTVPEPDSNSNSTNVNNTKYSDTEAEKSNTSINSIAIPARVFENITSNETGVLFSFYIDDALFPIRINQTESENTTYKAIGSSVISATLAGLTIKNVPELINITMSIIISNWSNPVCVSYNFSEAGGNWTAKGCRVMSVDEDSGLVVCGCNHLTNFGILVDVNARTSTPRENKALRVFSIAGSIMSMVGLIITIITLLGFKKLRQKEASKFHVQLCIAIFCMLLFFLIGIDRTESEIGCTICSLLIQYFTMASVAWMGAEAVLMFHKLIIVFGHIHLVIISIVAWAVPAPFLVIGLGTLGTGKNFLISEGNFCFISDIGVFFGLFLGPILALVLFNTVVFALVIRVLIKHSCRKLADVEKRKKLQGTIKTLISVISIMFMFGLQWLFGAFTIAEASEVFQWLFVIFSTLQGFFLFLFFCVLTQDAREEWLNFFSFGHRKKKKRGVITSHASQGAQRDRNTGSTYITSKHSQTLRRGILSSADGDSVVEMRENRKKFLALPTSISDDKETVFIIENGDTENHTSSAPNGLSTDISSKPPPIEVPEHILQRRFMYSYNPATSSPPIDVEEDNKDKEYEDDTVASEASTTDCYDISTAEYGDLTQLTDLSVITNSDVSDTEEISHL